MNDLLKIRTLTEKFFEGDTTPEEEQVLYNFYWQDSIPEDLRPNRELFRDLAVLATLAPARRAALPHRHRWWVAAAVAALLIVGGTALYRYQAENECVAYIYGERVTDREVVLGEMQKTMTAIFEH